ncbi:MAG: T9SS type A sorting domain-containing protein [Fluviicola sp.]|nr:T9SS type A sorting domain-containing protein [Fluviicola sp.]MBP6271584.1 T9SS type A sorting domain-containing protein [Fluviicola sp.]
MKNNYNKWKGISLIVAFVLTAISSLNAQVSGYGFNQSVGTYTAITGGTVLGTTSNDDDNFTNLPIGFTFNYNGTNYTSFSANANGFIAMGGSVTNSYTGLSGSNNNVVSALSVDLLSNGTTGELSYQTIGTAPNRVFVIQWKNYEKYATTGDNYNFQIRLNETTNYIQIVYGSMANGSSADVVQVGLRGATATDFNNRTTSWAASTAGTSNTANLAVSSTSTPATGTTYTWIGNPDAPAALVQASGTPTCATGTGLTTTSTAPTDVTYYWQTTATGTSTATPYAGAYTVYANGTFYLRAKNTVGNTWSPAVSIVVTNMPVATAPPAPTAAANPACAPGTTVSVAAAPSGTTYYWQTVANGSTTTNNAATALPVTASGTYYVSAFDAATSCWSNTSSIAVVVDAYIPPTPLTTINPLNVCSGATTAPLTVTPAASSGTAVVTFGSNVNVAAGLTSNLSGTLSIPVGSTITSAVLSFNGVTTTSGTWPSDLDIQLSGAASVALTTLNPAIGSVTNAGPYTHNATSVSTGTVNLSIIHGYSFGGPASFSSVTLTVNYTLPAPTLEWYTASTGGTLLGTGGTLETVGTSVLANTNTAGAYDFYARAVVGGCQSVALPIVVNVTPVLATIVPVDASCNGQANGSFTLGTVTCGTGPFAYAISDGTNPYSTFGPIPTNLAAGTYFVKIQSASAQVSSPITLVIGQPTAPTALTATNVSYFNATLGWTASGNETSWVVEYGPTGFTPGTGTIVTANQDSLNITGLLANSCYQFYVKAGCVTTSAVAGPFAFCTDPGFLAWDNACPTGGFVDISGTGTQITGITDDSEFGLTLPWNWNIGGTQVSTVTIGNNGGVLFNTLTGQVGYTATGNGLFPFAEDLGTITAGGIYYQSIGTAPNRQFIIEWFNIPYYGSPNSAEGATFEIIVDEATSEVYYVYTDVTLGSTFEDYGADAEIAMITANGSAFVSSNNTAYLTSNTCAHFYNALCPNITTFISTISTDDAILDWNPGLYGETSWTLIYGPAGFDPAATPSQAIGTPQTLSTSDASFGNSLTQLTAYDVYIYSECTQDNLTSGGYLYSFTTLPNCSYPSNIVATTDVDSLEVTWNWAQSSVGTQISDFNVAYVMTGNNVYSGTEVATGSTNTNDTIFDQSLLGGGVYQVYVQAVCANGDTSSYVGPVNVVMPLTNDLVCGADTLALNTNYTFNNTGATVSLDEINIAPAVTGAQTTTGWINNTLNGTTWFKFIAPASGQVRIDFTATNYNGQAAVYDAASCSDFNNNFDILAANDNAIGGTSLAPNFTVCGLTPGDAYYIMHDGFTGTSGVYGIRITEVVVNAGTANATTNVCSGNVLNLDGTITGNDLGGTWTAPVNAVNASIFGSSFQSAGIAFQTFNFQYQVVDGCASDTVVSKVRIFAPSSAGIDGSITVCKNEPLDLLAGLSGNVDLNGTWYDPANVTLASSNITASAFQGNYNYDYIAGNGVCPDDTANVVVTVLGTCDFLDIDEATFAGIEVYPNPTNGMVYVSASNNAGTFNYEVTDANGRVIATAVNAINGAATTSIDLSKVETGVYFIRLSNTTGDKVYRVVVQ